MEQLWNEVVAQFRCDVKSIHGERHWRRVLKNGLVIASDTPGVNAEVVKLFSAIHDSQRTSDWEDHNHGELAAQYATSLRGRLVHLDDYWFSVLHFALRFHAKGFNHADPTIGACWDADRLDLTRIGIDPDPDLLSTEAARTMATATLRVP